MLGLCPREKEVSMELNCFDLDGSVFSACHVVFARDTIVDTYKLITFGINTEGPYKTSHSWVSEIVIDALTCKVIWRCSR
jgi:hypothetical protein